MMIAMDRNAADASEGSSEIVPSGSKHRLDETSERRHRAFLAGSVLLWASGALSTHWFGVWAGIGWAAVILGLWGFLLDDRLSADLRRPSPKLLGIGSLGGLFMLGVTYFGFAVVMAGMPGLRG